MRKLFVDLLIIFAFVFLGGCAGHCVKIGGKYEGIQGDVEYCFDSKESGKAGVPSWSITSDDDITEKLYSFTEEQVKKIWEKFRDKAEKIIPLDIENKHPVRAILEEIQKEPKMIEEVTE